MLTDDGGMAPRDISMQEFVRDILPTGEVAPHASTAKADAHRRSSS